MSSRADRALFDRLEYDDGALEHSGDIVFRIPPARDRTSGNFVRPYSELLVSAFPLVLPVTDEQVLAAPGIIEIEFASGTRLASVRSIR